MTGYARRDDWADTCPYCKADLRGEPIPEEHRHQYPSGAVRYSRLIGISDPYRDRIVEWQCPDCQRTWPRGGYA